MMKKEIIVGSKVGIPKLGEGVFGVVTEINGLLATCEFWTPGSKGKSVNKFHIDELELVNLNEILNPDS